MNSRSLFTLLIVFLFNSNLLIGQKNYLLKFPSESRISLETTEDFQHALGIHANNSLTLDYSQTDQLNIEHRKYQQNMDGFPVEGAVLAVHNYPNGNQMVNGLWLKNTDTNIPQTLLTEQEVFDVIRNNFSSERQMTWELDDIDNRFEPIISKVWYDENYSKEGRNYQFVYKVKVYVSNPFEAYDLFIEASSGQVINQYSTLHAINIPGTGEGLYTNGPVTFTIDSLSATSYEMVKHNDDGEVMFRTQNELDNFNVISSSTNQWLDQAAVDCHWGTEKTLQYFQEVHNRTGLDGNGGEILVNVHAQDPFSGGPLVNAYYDNSTINIGDGAPGSTIEVPLSTLDIVGHELVHGVTEFTANLIYANESGAINESMSDIFGVTSESYTTGTYNWELGEQLNYIIRRMNDPKSLGMPAFYQGENWVDGADVHTNSAIGNLWYYYLVEGGSGINENGETFNVEALGFDKAGAIAYRALSEYLTESSDYSAYYDLSIQAAEDLFGACSPEVTSVSIAWSAVGVGLPIFENDLSLKSIEDLESDCGLGEENITVRFQFQSCGDSIPAGTEINMFYAIDGGAPVSEIYVLADTLAPKEFVDYVFTQTADLSVVAWYDIKTWVNYNLDTYNSNDSLSVAIENRVVQNEDFNLAGLVFPSQSTYCGLTTEDPIVQLEFLGCETLLSGAVVNVKASLGSNVVEDNITLTSDLNYGDVVDLTIPGTLEVTSFGVHQMDLEVSFPGDPFLGNNTFSTTIEFLESKDSPFVYPFDNASEVLALNINLGAEIDQDTLVVRFDDPSESEAILFSGGDFIEWNTAELLIDPVGTIDEIWTQNPGYESRTCICVDATEWGEVYLSFDLYIHQVEAFWFFFGIQDPYFSNMRVLVDGTPVTETFGFENQVELDNHIVDLSDYAGTSFEVCFQTKSIIGRNQLGGFVTGRDLLGDHVILDNINVRKQLEVSSNDQQIDNYQLSIFPNPAHQEITVSLTSKITQELTFELINASGQKVMLKKQLIHAGKNDQKISLSDVTPGVYLLNTRFHTDDKTTVSKLVVK